MKHYLLAISRAQNDVDMSGPADILRFYPASKHAKLEGPSGIRFYHDLQERFEVCIENASSESGCHDLLATQVLYYRGIAEDCVRYICLATRVVDELIT